MKSRWTKTLLQCSCFRGDKGRTSKPLSLVSGSQGKHHDRIETWPQAGANTVYVFVVTNGALKPSLTSWLSLKQGTNLEEILASVSISSKSNIYQYNLCLLNSWLWKYIAFYQIVTIMGNAVVFFCPNNFNHWKTTCPSPYYFLENWKFPSLYRSTGQKHRHMTLPG